jgi:hypothetical protein
MKRLLLSMIAVTCLFCSCEVDTTKPSREINDPLDKGISALPAGSGSNEAATGSPLTIYGSLKSISVADAGCFAVAMPDGSCCNQAKEFAISGHCAPWRDLDAAASKLTYTSCKFNGILNRFESNATIDLVSLSDGSSIRMFGYIYTCSDYSCEFYFFTQSGTGRFASAYGRMTATGTFNKAKNEILISPAGFIRID